jgi:hypothetical protein
MSSIPKKERICKVCGNVYYYTGTHSAFCSNECKSIDRRKQHYGLISPPERICEFCKKSFIPRNSIQIFCSKECCNNKQGIGYIYIFERDNFRCIYCGKSSIEDGVKLHLDHVFPKSKGGTSQSKNLVTACELCNLMKYNRVFSDQTESRILTIIENRNKEHGINPEMVIKLHDQRE